MAGQAFTAADISVTFVLQMADRHDSYALGPVECDYLARTTGRDAYRRAMEACPAIKTGVAELNAQAAAQEARRSP